MILLYSLFFMILFHELGHLWAAKLCKCGVKTFSIGFGKALWSKKIGKTVYQIAPILFGGYCELQGEMTYTRSKYAFTNKTYGQKVFISFAGILMNLITGLIAYGLAILFHNKICFLFSFYSIILGLSNALPIPALDGSYWIAFLFEKKYGKKRSYEKISNLFKIFFIWIMILNILSIPYLIWLVTTKQLL
jgi:membrane-associated protease RseP (regulator of RpoE activity)